MTARAEPVRWTRPGVGIPIIINGKRGITTPGKIPPCPERLTQPQAVAAPVPHPCCVECGRVTIRTWTDKAGTVLAWCGGEMPAGQVGVPPPEPVREMGTSEAQRYIEQWNRGTPDHPGVPEDKPNVWLVERSCSRCKPDDYCRRHTPPY